MGKIISAVEKVAFFNPANGETVQLNDLSPDETEIVNGNITNNTSTGVTHGGIDFNAAVGFFDGEGLSQLGEWADNGSGVYTPVEMVAAGEDEFLLMQQPEALTIERGVGVDARNGASVHVANIGHVGYKPDIFQYRNLVNAGADAFTIFESGSSNGLYKFILPVQGIRVSVGATYTGSPSTSIRVEFRDFDNNILTSNVTNVSQPIRYSVTTDISPANTYFVEIKLDGNTTGGITFEDVAIRLGPNAAYTTD